MAEVIVGLKKLHESGYLHADLKLENVMKATDGHIKLIDFGLSRELKNLKHYSSEYGTREYFAPEALNGIIWYVYIMLII